MFRILVPLLLLSSPNLLVNSLANLPLITSSTLRHKARHGVSTRLFSLKPAAVPLMDSGKALARSAELLIELTTSLSLYGTSLSSSAASLRNCGDHLAQAAASCRFKTGLELVVDELREGADCLLGAVDFLGSAVEESRGKGVGGSTVNRFSDAIGNMIPHVRRAGGCIEQAGVAILQRREVEVVGRQFVECGEALGDLAVVVEGLDSHLGSNSDSEKGKLSGKRMAYAGECMILAGRELLGEKEGKGNGKSWIKG